MSILKKGSIPQKRCRMFSTERLGCKEIDLAIHREDLTTKLLNMGFQWAKVCRNVASDIAIERCCNKGVSSLSKVDVAIYTFDKYEYT